MIRIVHNNRHLGINFCYTKTYDVRIPDPKWEVDFVEFIKDGNIKPFKGLPRVEREKVLAENAAWRRQAKKLFLVERPRMITVKRPLTQCYITEGEGAKRIILGKYEAGLHINDTPFTRDDPRREGFYKLMIRFALKDCADNLTKDERGALWVAFLTRFSKRRSVLAPPDDPTPSPASSARAMSAIVEVPNTDANLERRIAGFRPDDPDQLGPRQLQSLNPPPRKPRVRMKMGGGYEILDPGFPPIDAHRVVSKVVSMPDRRNYPRKTADGHTLH